MCRPVQAPNPTVSYLHLRHLTGIQNQMHTSQMQTFSKCCRFNRVPTLQPGAALQMDATSSTRCHPINQITFLQSGHCRPFLSVSCRLFSKVPPLSQIRPYARCRTSSKSSPCAKCRPLRQVPPSQPRAASKDSAFRYVPLSFRCHPSIR